MITLIMIGNIDVEILETPDLVAARAASIIAEEAKRAVAARRRFVFAVSGGRTPWQMLRILTSADVRWPAMHIVQVDERVAPAGHPDRNLTHIADSLRGARLNAGQITAMPVEAADLEEAAAEYEALPPGGNRFRL